MTPAFDFEDSQRQFVTGLAETARRPNFNRYKPHAKQAHFEQDQHKHRLYVGGNRGGKTVGGVIEAIRYAKGEHPYRQVPAAPNYGRVVGSDFPSGIDKVIIPTFQQWIPKSLLKNGSWDDSYAKQDHVLKLTNGSIIEFMSADQDLQKFAGASRHWIWFDEEQPELIYDECRARLIDTNGVFWMTLTPVYGLEYIYDKVYLPGLTDPEHSLYGVTEVDMADNTYLDPAAVKEYLESLTKEQRAIREHGQFIQVGGTVFPDFDLTRHVVPTLDNPRPFRLTRKHRVYVSIDYGWRDPTAIYWNAVDREGHVTSFREYYLSHHTIEESVQSIRDINKEIRVTFFGDEDDTWEPDLYVGDPALKQTNGIKGTSYLMEFGAGGINIAVEMIPRNIEPGLNKMLQYMKTDPRTGRPWWEVVGSECPNLVRELLKLRWKRRQSRQDEIDKNKLMEIQERDNHAFDSTRYFFTLMQDLSAPKNKESLVAMDHQDFYDTLNAVPQATGRDGTYTRDQWSVERLGDWAGLEA